MKHGDRVKWISGIGKQRTGEYIIEFKCNPGFVLILGDDGKQHTMRAEKPLHERGGRDV